MDSIFIAEAVGLCAALGGVLWYLSSGKKDNAERSKVEEKKEEQVEESKKIKNWYRN